MQLARRLIDKAKEKLDEPHRIRLISTHEIEHDGSIYRIAKTTRGTLVLFPHAKKVSTAEFVSELDKINQIPRDLNAGNYTIKRLTHPLEYKGHIYHHYSEEDEWEKAVRWTSRRPYEVASSQRKGALKLFHRVRKPGSKRAPQPLEEAVLLHHAIKGGIRAEAPVAVFIGRRNFPEFMLTTMINRRNNSYEYEDHGPTVGPKSGKAFVFEQVLTRKREEDGRRIHLDAESSFEYEASKEAAQDARNAAREIRRKIAAL